MFLFQDSIEGQTETISKSSETLFREKTEVCQFAFRYPKQALLIEYVKQKGGGSVHIYFICSILTDIIQELCLACKSMNPLNTSPDSYVTLLSIHL
jgi:hypothetical protein